MKHEEHIMVAGKADLGLPKSSIPMYNGSIISVIDKLCNKDLDDWTSEKNITTTLANLPGTCYTKSQG